ACQDREPARCRGSRVANAAIVGAGPGFAPALRHASALAGQLAAGGAGPAGRASGRGLEPVRPPVTPFAGSRHATRRMCFRTPQSSPRMCLARLLLAGLLIVMGAWRLWGVVQGGKSSGEMLSFSVAGLLVGLAVAGGWRLRWSALLAAALVLAEAVLWHPFWSLGEPARSAQLLHFMKNAALVGGFLLLSLTAPTRRR